MKWRRGERGIEGSEISLVFCIVFGIDRGRSDHDLEKEAGG